MAVLLRGRLLGTAGARTPKVELGAPFPDVGELLTSDVRELGNAPTAAPNAAEAVEVETRPLVLVVNVRGPDSLAGRLSHLNPAADVRHPANAAAVFHAVARLLATSPGQLARGSST